MQDKEKLERIYKGIIDIANMTDEECDQIEAEIKKKNIFK